MSPAITALFGAILVIVLILFATERIEKTIVAMLGALLCLFLGYGFHIIHEPESHIPFYIQTINWHTVGIIIGATVFVEIISHSGIFTWTAVRLMKLSGGDPFRLLVYFSLLTVAFSAVLDNITAMILIGSLTIVASKSLHLKLVPFLVTEGILSNIGGMLTLISSIPNIIVGTEAHFSYVYYFVTAAPYVATATMATIFIARRLFGSAVAPLATKEERLDRRRHVEQFDEWETVQDRRFFNISWVALGLVVLGFAVQSYVPILKEMHLESVAFAAAAFMLLLYPHDVEERLSQVEWSLIFFFTGLFIIIGVMEEAHVLEAIGHAIAAMLERSGHFGGMLLLWATALFSSVTDNIPLAAMLAKIVKSAGLADGNVSIWWAVILGANLGGNITPIGSASTLIATNLLKREGSPIGFLGFARLGALFALTQLLLASAYVTAYMAGGNAFLIGANAVLYGGAIVWLVVRRVRRRVASPQGAAAEQERNTRR